MESQEPSKPKYWQRYIVCTNYNITEGCYDKLEWIDFELIPGLLVISMVFLLLTFVPVYLEQREKLFG